MCNQDMSAPPTDPKALRTYILHSPGPKMEIDAIGMVENLNIALNAETLSQIALFQKPVDSIYKPKLITTHVPKNCNMYPCVIDSDFILPDSYLLYSHDQMTASKEQIRFTVRNMLYAMKWNTLQPIKIKNTEIGSESLVASADDILHAVIRADSVSKPILSVSNTPNFISYNLFENDSASPMRVLIGKFFGDTNLGLALWNKDGSPIGVSQQNTSGTFNAVNSSIALPNVCVNETNCVLSRVVLGDLDQDGMSDLVIAKIDGIKIHYAKVDAGNTSFTEETNYPDALKTATNVQAIAVSIPSGNDKPKLVWATSSFTPSSMGSTTGTNTITINVLPIKK